MMSRPLKVLLAVQPSVSHYRAPFVQALLDQQDVEFELVGRVNRVMGSGADPKSATEDVLAHVGELRRRGIIRDLYWDRGLVSRVWRTSADAVVLEGNVYGLSNWIAIAIARMRRRRVVFWGHAWKRPESGMKLRLRRFFYKRADGHLTYGEWAPRFAASVGLDASTFVPVFNSIYPLAQIASEPPRSGRPSSAGSTSLIYSGRLTARHRAEEAIAAVLVANAEGHDMSLVIVGDGPERDRLESLARNSDRVHFRGAVYDVDELRRIYRTADYAVSPGASGLNVIQALGFAVPVIASSGDPQSGPEIEAVIDGTTGLLYAAEERVSGLVTALERAAGLGDDEYSACSRAAQELVRERYTSETHASALIIALRHLLAV